MSIETIIVSLSLLVAFIFLMFGLACLFNSIRKAFTNLEKLNEQIIHVLEISKFGYCDDCPFDRPEERDVEE